MKRRIWISGLVAGAALSLLGGCASYDEVGSGYYGGTYDNNGYYGPDYDSTIFYGGSYYGPSYYYPRGGYGYRRDWRGGERRDFRRGDGDNRDFRRGDGEHRDFRRGDNDGNRNFSRNQPQTNVQPSQPAPSSGWRGGHDGGGASSGGFRSGGSQSGGSDRSAGSQSGGGPQGRFGHPGTPNNPL